jgi:hypothetical protein
LFGFTVINDEVYQAYRRAYPGGGLNPIVFMVGLFALLALCFIVQTAAVVIAPAVAVGKALTTTSAVILKFSFRVIRDRLAVKLQAAPAPPVDNLVEVACGPELDPTRGIFLRVDVDGVEKRVVIAPEWWKFLPAGVDVARHECAMLGSTPSSVALKAEPRSLVMIQQDSGRVVGVGSRVKYGSSDVLLTSTHVLRVGRIGTEKLYLAKHDKQGILQRVELGPWPIAFASGDEVVDLTAVQVPPLAWSKLGVSAAKTAAPRSNNVAVSVYGVNATDNTWRCSLGLGKTGEVAASLSHSCTTFASWSGSPIYNSNGAVIAVHRQSLGFGKTNLGTTIFPFMLEAETMDASAPYREITVEEINMPERFPKTVTVRGRGEYSFTDTEFVRPSVDRMLDFENRMKSLGKPLWSEAMDEFDEEENMNYDDSYETFPLNEMLGSQAPQPLMTSMNATTQLWTDSVLESTLRPLRLSSHSEPVPTPATCKPSETLADTNSAMETASMSQESEWNCESAGGLESVLGKLLQKPEILGLLVQSIHSLNSKTSTGPREAPMLNSAPSSSKQDGTGKRRRRKASRKRAKDLSRTIQEDQSGDASEHGTNSKLKKNSTRFSRTT